jgi:hypothetical protein
MMEGCGEQMGHFLVRFATIITSFGGCRWQRRHNERPEPRQLHRQHQRDELIAPVALRGLDEWTRWMSFEAPLGAAQLTPGADDAST